MISIIVLSSIPSIAYSWVFLTGYFVAGLLFQKCASALIGAKISIALFAINVIIIKYIGMHCSPAF
ncbi:MAG: hypothetical protein EBT10_00255 [Methylocystaceae bacterium]|nr:hypothetical protein [Methylocystaceae bacterium]